MCFWCGRSQSGKPPQTLELFLNYVNKNLSPLADNPQEWTLRGAVDRRINMDKASKNRQPKWQIYILYIYV